ncbi:MAG: hypothetical protein HY885_17295 [Deltaproteobacteria bacterium]|nr:hypothetical protein [Deltaproteobacteria bacterium]
MISCLLICLLFLCAGCNPDPPEQKSQPPARAAAAREFSCRHCHEVALDARHEAIPCTTCHAGQDAAPSAETAHQGLVKQPAHPRHMEKNCGACHAGQLAKVRNSLHFTLKQEVNAVRLAFGAGGEVESLLDIPQHEEVGSPLELADDLLRRRCLRCHLYYEGDRYAETRHGTGCAACHMEFGNGKAVSHAFVKTVPDSQCLHCHYANFVGADYHGRFEHDYHWDYRTPYPKEGNAARPYGVEYHQLAPDVHQQAGLSCVDCHSGRELMGMTDEKITCASCHLWQPGDKIPLDNLKEENGSLILTRRLGDRNTGAVPRLSHPAHERYQNKADCAVCHAQWSFSDEGTHLLRLDTKDFEPWSALYIQGSSEVEEQLINALYGDDSYEYVFMTDKITDELYSGLWLKGYELRRWEFPIICKDDRGMLRVCRPLLDLHLSYVNEKGETVFDAIAPQSGREQGLRPYTPHTIGKAGAFFTDRLRENTDLVKAPLNLEKNQEIPPTP